MDHDYIEEQQVVDRYLMKQLPDDEAVRFEDHYVHCQQCLDELEVAEKLQRGFKRAVAEDVVRLGLAARLARLVRVPWAGPLALALLAATVLPLSLLVRDRDRLADLQGELDAARSALTREEGVRRDLDERLAQALDPQINTALFSWSPERGAGSEPTHVVRLAAEPEWIVLSLELEYEEPASYDAVLALGREEVWRRDGLISNHLGAVVLSLHSSGLVAGDYLLRVEAPGVDGDAVTVGRFSFRVIAGE